jgi:hypothetical protein
MKFFISHLAIIAATVFGCSNSNISNDPAIKRSELKKMKLKATDARVFCQSKKFNIDFCILIDMSVHSGLKRFFVWDFQKDTISYSCLVGHGCGDNRWSSDQSKDHPVFSNRDGSHCSALGKYKLGERAYSDWGIHIKYLMHGLESTNNNALVRTIVFHSWDEVEDEEIYPDGTAEGWGCPTISNKSMKILDPKLKASKEAVLMWIYN